MNASADTIISTVFTQLLQSYIRRQVVIQDHERRAAQRVAYKYVSHVRWMEHINATDKVPCRHVKDDASWIPAIAGSDGCHLAVGADCMHLGHAILRLPTGTVLWQRVD